MSNQSYRYKIRFFSLLALLSMVAGLLSGCLGPDATPTTIVSPTSTTVLAQPTNTTVAAAPTNTTVAAQPTATIVASQPTNTTVAIDPTATSGAVAAATPTVSGSASGPRNSALPRFASYNANEPTLSPSVPEYSVEPGMANVSNPDDFPLTDAQKDALVKYAFVAAPPPTGSTSENERIYRQFFQLYEDGRYEDLPAFVTTDSVLHIYHLMFDKLLRTVESTYLTSYIKTLTAALLTESQVQLAKLQGTPAAADARRNVAYLAVAQKLIDPSASVPAEVADMIDAELAQISKHEGLAPSNIFTNYNEDYSQYVPRGHYTRSVELENYFRTMMWYGRMTFRLKDAGETRSAILLTRALADAKIGEGTAAQLWQRIYEPTVFFVGEADDLSYFDYAPIVESAFGSADFALTNLNDTAKLDAFNAAAAELQGPRINSMFVYFDQDKETETKGLRMMGQRFTIDAYVFGQLIWRNVGTAPEPDVARWLPKALDFPAALGSESAYNILQEMGETSGPKNQNYDAQLAKVRGEIAGLPEDQWSENLYWGWLNTFRSLLEPTSAAGYPQFMRGDAWNNKELNTILGSYTELKHDTVLYAKQVMAEAGGAAPQEPKGYVEPYPAFYARVAALVRMTIDGLSGRHILPEELQDPLTELEKLARDLQTISEKELRNETLSSTEYDLIHYYGAKIEHLTYDAADLDGEGRPTMEDQDSALVTDVATDPNGFVLQEGTGRPMEIFVVAPIEGQLIVTRGAIYSQYEFSNDISNRLTDDQWKEIINNGQLPPMEGWKKVFVVE